MKKMFLNFCAIALLSLSLTACLKNGDNAAPTESDFRVYNSTSPSKPSPFDLGEEDMGTKESLTALLNQPELPKTATPGKKPMIAIVIDDVGVDRKRSARTVKELPAPVTLSYLPYSLQIKEQVKSAKDKGHEVIVHMPMQPDRDTADAGPNHLAVNMTKEELQKRLKANLDAFSGYDGVNNHMGSKFTCYKPGLDIVMTELAKRHVFFLDSKTSPDSIAEKVAKDHGLQSTHRDVFLDHIETPEFAVAALKHTEDVARATGSAIAIGHPKDITLAALEAWLPTLEAKGFELVPLSTVIQSRNASK